ncbi:virion associated RNA polymerase [Pectobacterium phage Possum]|uniref:Virion associated RNA polymerase n=1 Tax=Pectobacterium phage Possum TaxID=2686301 RepID=A0A7U3SV30_9CAUD|nr:virion associated RNA polymerase [Pectobacterium phage Possum]QPL10924.1 virion associated RNA polymerase [Pectobacterium phage Possum]QPL11026.1 virion associated RNA polymerase [Pectobacterium phage Horatius]
MARSLLTDALNALSNGEFTNPSPAVSVPQAAPVQPVSKEDQILDATNRINSGFAAKGQYPSISGEIERLKQQAAGREQVTAAYEADMQKFVPTNALESGSPVIRTGAQITNAMAGFGSSIARIALQVKNLNNLGAVAAGMDGATDDEKLAFNRESTERSAQVAAQVGNNARRAQDILGGTPGASAKAIAEASEIPTQLQAYPSATNLLNREIPAGAVKIPSAVQDDSVLGRVGDYFNNLNDRIVGASNSLSGESKEGQTETVRDRLQRAQTALTKTQNSLGNTTQGVDNEWGTDAWVNREPTQRMAQQLAEENKDATLLGAIGNTVGEYLKNPSLVIQSAAESLPYALGRVGIITGTTGQAVQNQTDGYRGQADGQLPTDEQIRDVTALNAVHSGLNFVENVVNARALSGLSNSALTAPLRRGGEALADTALGRAVANVVARNGVSRAALAAGRAVTPAPVRELATTMAINGLTEAAQNQIETRNLLGDDRIDFEGNVNAGVLGALSAGVMTGPSTLAAGARGIGDRVARTIQERQDAANPRGAEQRQAAQDAAKPFADLTNPEHADYNPQAAVRQQTNVFADTNATPEMRQEAIDRAQIVRDNAEQNLASVTEEVQGIQRDVAMRQEVDRRLTDIEQNPDSEYAPMREQLETIRDQIDERLPDDAAQQDLISRFQTANDNVERVRAAYDQFENAAGLRERNAPEDTQAQMETATNPDATPEQVNQAADHVVTHPMQYTPEQLQSLASDTTNRFSDSQRDAIRALADARVAQNRLKKTLTVNQDIMQGGQGYRSLGEYTSAYADAIRSGNATTTGNLRQQLARFQASHEQKAQVAQNMMDTGNYGQMIRRDGQWVVNDGPKLRGADKARNGALDIHKGSAGLVAQIRQEADAIRATGVAMDAMNQARPAAPAAAPQPSSPAPANDATTTVEAKPQPAVVESEATVTKSSLSHYANDGILTQDADGDMALRLDQFTPAEQQFLRENNMVDAQDMVKADSLRRAAPRKDDAHKPRTLNQQDRVAPAEQQTQQEQVQAQDSNENDPTIAATSETDANVVSDQTTATKTDENTKADGATRVLRPEGQSLEAARTAERAKPFDQQNLVLTGFIQRVREGFVNPLVTNSDFMSSVMQKADWSGRFTELNRYLAQPMNAAQKNLMGMFVNFHKAVEGNIDPSIKQKIGKTRGGLDRSAYNFQDFVQFLTTDGKLDENTKTALTASMFTWLAENGNKLIATREDIAGLFHMDKGEVPTDVVNRFSEIGSSQRAVIQSLGQRAYQMLGFKVLKDVDPNRAGRMQQALGMYAMHTMMQRGYLEQTSMTAREYADVITSGLDTESAQAKRAEFAREFLGGEDINKSKEVFNFVRVPRQEVNGQLVPANNIGRIVEANKGTSGVMSKLFSFDSSQTFPLTKKPGKFMQNTVGDFGQQVPSELAERLTKAQQQPYRINESLVNAMNTIRNGDEAALLHMMGVRTEAETPFMHNRDRIGQQAKNDDIVRALSNADEVISGLDSIDQQVFMPLSVWSNNRVGVASNMLNPQGNKVHRALVGMEAHRTSIPVNQTATDGNGNITEYGQFLLTVAQGMEEAPIKKPGTTDNMPTVDKVTGKTYLQGMQGYLESEHVQAGVTSMINVIEGKSTPRDIATVKDLVAEFGMGPHSFESLHALALAEQARRNGNDTVEVAIGGESDGVTNGPILTNVLYGTADTDLLARGGLYTADAGVTNVPQYREQGGQDYYQLLGTAQKNAWDAMYPPTTGRVTDQNQKFRRAIDYLSPGFGSRSKAKVQATPFNYGSGMDSLKRASARDTIDSVYGHITNIAEAYSRSKVEGDFQRHKLEKAIEIVLAQGKTLGIKTPAFSGLGKTESLLTTDLPKPLTEALMQIDMATRGEASQTAIEQVAAHYIKTRDTNTAITNAAFEVGKVVRDRAEAIALSQAVNDGQVGSINGVAVEGLSTDAKANLSAQLRDSSAIVPTATGSQSSNKLESGYVAAKVNSTFKSNDPTTEVYASFMDAANPKGTGLTNTKPTTFKDVRSGAQVKEQSAPGVSTSALVVQGTDAAISTRVIAERPAQNFHDANLFGIKDMVDGAKAQNKAMWDTVVGYDSQLANTEAMIRTLDGATNQDGLQPSDWTNIAGALRQLAFKAELTASPRDAISPSAVLGRVVGDAYNREIAKLSTLNEVEYVNQYGYEGGEYRVTAADRKALADKIVALREQRDNAIVAAETLGDTLAQKMTDGTTPAARNAEKVAAAQRRQAIEQAAADSVPVTRDAKGKNALERFLSESKDGTVNAKDLMNFTVKALASGRTDGSALQSRMRTTYSELAKVLAATLPDNLSVNILSAQHNPKGVMGAEQNANSRAWFYSDGKVNQINIKMDGAQAPGLEVVLHEMLHAATARALDTARRDPKANPALTEIVGRLESLRSEVEQSVQSIPEFAPAVRNIDELISWGLTNPAFQQHLDGLQSSMYPRQREGVRNRLGSMFKEFANTVLRAVYAFTGRKPTAKQMTAMEALILDTADALQFSTINPGNTNSVNLAMASSTRAAQTAGQYTHRQVFDSLSSATAGKQNSTSFTGNLGKIIDNVSDKLFSQVSGDHLTTVPVGQGYTPGQVWANALNTGKAPFTTKALAAGFHMTDREAFAIESIETAVAATLNSGFGTAVNRELRKSWEAARKQITPEQFHNGNWNTATPAEKAMAQAKWDHLFKLEATQSGQNRYLSQFVAMTLGHEETSNLMGFTANVADASKAVTPFEKASGFFNHAVNWASGQLTRTNEGQLVSQKTQALAQQLVEIELKNRDKSESAIEQAFTYVSDMGEKLGNKVWDAAHATADAKLIRENPLGIVRAAGSITRLAAKRNLDGLADTIRQVRDMSNPNTADGWAAQILGDMTNPDKVRSAFESLQRHTNLIEQRRRNLSEITRGNVMGTFEDGGKYLTEADKTALSYTLLRTEAYSLLNTRSLADVQALVSSPAKRRAEIAKLEQSVLADPNGNDMVIRAKALGYYMVTGKATIAGMAKNAQAIASGAGTHYVTTEIADRNSVLAENIDQLATMYALNYSKPEHLTATAAVMKRELANPDNGINALLNVHKVLSEDAASTLFQNNEISRIKGYIPEVTNPYRDVKIVEQGEGAELEAMGYQFVGMVPTDPTIPSMGNKAMYVTKDNGSQRYVSGATSLTSNQRKGSSAVRNQNYRKGQGPTVADGSKAVYAAARRRAQGNHSAFDPAAVQDTFMIPVFGTDGRIMDFQYEMNATNRDTLLDRNNDFAHLLGQYAGQNFDKQHSPDQNRMVMEALNQDYKSNYAASPERYVAIGPQSADARSREIWAMLPEQTRYDAEQIWGAGEPIQVRSDLVNLVFGFRKLTVANAFDKDAQDRNLVESLAASVFDTVGLLTNRNGKVLASQTERAAQEGVGLLKDIIVLRNVSTLVRNLAGNAALLKAYGVSPIDIVKDTKVALQAGLSYRKNTALLLKYQQQQRAGIGNYEQLEQRIIQLEDQLARNPLRDFINEGTMPSIVDDVDTADTAYTYTSGLQNKISGVTEMIPASVRTAAKWAFVSKDTPLYKFLSNTAQFGDFTSKYVLYKYSMNKADTKLNHAEAVQRATDAFVNYDTPTSPELQYMNDVGLLMFTKYRLRIQRAMMTLMKERPGTALAQSILVSRFTDAPPALEPNLITGLGNPFASGVLQLPGALTQPLPIKLILGSM